MRPSNSGLAGTIIRQYGLQHRIENRAKEPSYRGYLTPAIEGEAPNETALEVERAARDITLGVITSKTAYADSSLTQVYLHSPSVNRETVLRLSRDANGKQFWTVVTAIPSDRAAMMRKYKAPTTLAGITFEGDDTQQVANIKRGTLVQKLQEPGQSPVSGASWIIDEEGSLYNGQTNTPVNVPVTVKTVNRVLPRDKDGKIILRRKREDDIQQSARTDTPQFKR